MRIEQKEDGSLEIWFSISELIFEGGAMYKLITAEERLAAEQLFHVGFCEHTTWMANEEDTRAFCLDCSHEWDLEPAAAEEANQQQDDCHDHGKLQGEDEKPAEG